MTVALFSNVLRVQIALHFTKVQEILFKNFCSLAPVLSIFGAPVALSYFHLSSINWWRAMALSSAWYLSGL
ncbi:hypothetical protein QP363_12630, partial [Corynebacterium sp. UMB6689]|nr:hypothetical protein [Corynebacterium sp. UMB6689]